ncbi:hypothetical protein H4R19_002983 [Coemansia spiralis]|nr:hypothetical protein H4R19_002983 [Coemansia spiralis]
MESIRVSTGTLVALGASAFGTSAPPHAGYSVDLSAVALRRRVSFNLDGNSVLHLPSNTAIAKISQARSRRSSGSVGSSEGVGDLGLAELAKKADRKAQALLPHGATLELLDSHCPMTALCVRHGHICAMNAGGSEHGLLALQLAPPKGVLKPFAPSPVNAKFLAHGLPGEVPECPQPEDAKQAPDAVVPDGDGAEDQTAPASVGRAPGRKAKRPASKKKKSQFKKRHQRQAPDSIAAVTAALQSSVMAVPVAAAFEEPAHVKPPN